MTQLDPDLPDALHEEAQTQDEGKAARLTSLGVTIAQLRDEAVKARKESGIEAVWMAAEEAYLCIDDLNRHEFKHAKWAKPTGVDGPLTREAPQRGSETRSSAFVRLTPRYVDMGAAKVSEILLPIDGKPFEFKPLPVPEVDDAVEDDTPVTMNGAPVMHTPEPEEPVPGQPAPPAQGPQPLTVGALAKKKLAKATDAAEKAEARIYSWMLEGGYQREMRKVKFDSARIGVGVLKAPFPDSKTTYVLSKQGDTAKLVIEEKTQPACKRIDPWNFYPHEACGENIHNGDYVFESDDIAAKQLKQLKKLRDVTGVPIYLAAQIDQVLEEGPDKCNLREGANPNHPKTKGQFKIWYFTGTVKLSDMQASDAIGLEDLPAELDEVFAIVTLVNDTVIRATINPLQSGRFPYHADPWSPRSGHWAGVGVGEQVSMAQRSVNAGVRALFNNAGYSAGVQIVIDQRAITPADKRWEMTPNKMWFLTGEGSADDVRKMFMLLEFPNIGDQLMKIIEFAFKMAEEASNIPLISQGQTGKDDPQTFGQAELQNSNANTLLRQNAYSTDDNVTEPVVHQYYEWLLLDPEVPEEEKDNFQINARGSIVMVEKAIQEQVWVQMLAVSLNPAYQLSPPKVAEQVLLSKRLDPSKVQLTDAERAQMAQQPPPVAPQVQAAQINAQTALHVQDMKDQAQLQQVQQEAAHEQQLLQSGGTTPHMAMATARIEAERIRAQSNESIQQSRAAAEQAYASTEAQIARDNAAARHQEILDKRELAILEYSLKNNQTLEQIKAQLAQTAMQEATKRQLGTVDTALTQSEGHADRSHDMQKHMSTVANDQAMQQADHEAAAAAQEAQPAAAE